MPHPARHGRFRLINGQFSTSMQLAETAILPRTGELDRLPARWDTFSSASHAPPAEGVAFSRLLKLAFDADHRLLDAARFAQSP